MSSIIRDWWSFWIMVTLSDNFTTQMKLFLYCTKKNKVVDLNVTYEWFHCAYWVSILNFHTNKEHTGFDHPSNINLTKLGKLLLVCLLISFITFILPWATKQASLFCQWPSRYLNASSPSSYLVQSIICITILSSPHSA